GRQAAEETTDPTKLTQAGCCEEQSEPGQGDQVPEAPGDHEVPRADVVSHHRVGVVTAGRSRRHESNQGSDSIDQHSDADSATNDVLRLCGDVHEVTSRSADVPALGTEGRYGRRDRPVVLPPRELRSSPRRIGASSPRRTCDGSTLAYCSG